MRLLAVLIIFFASSAYAGDATKTINPAAKGFKTRFTAEEWSAAQRANMRKFAHVNEQKNANKPQFHQSGKGTELKKERPHRDFWGNVPKTAQEEAADFLTRPNERRIIR